MKYSFSWSEKLSETGVADKDGADFSELRRVRGTSMNSWVLIYIQIDIKVDRDARMYVPTYTSYECIF